MFKRGIASLIATVLMILITIATVGIIVQAVMPIIKGNIEVVNSCDKVKLEIDTEGGFSVYDSSSNVLSVAVSRGPESVALDGFQLKIIDLNGQSKIAEIITNGNYSFIDSTQMPEINSISNYNINVSMLNMSYVSKASVAPIIQIGKTSKICSSSSNVDIPKSSGAINFTNPTIPGNPTGGIDTNGLVAFWKMEDAGSTAVDSFAGVNGNINGAVSSTGILGNSLAFDGNDYINLPLNPTILSMQQGTISIWVYPTELNSADGYEIFSYGGAYMVGFAGFFRFELMPAGSNGYLRTLQRTNDEGPWGQIISGSNPSDFLTINNWHHLALTSDGSAWRMYHNGVEMDYNTTGSNTGDLIADTAVTSPAVLRIGNLYQSGSDYSFFRGRIDETAIYSRALNSTEIAYLYNNGTGRSYP